MITLERILLIAVGFLLCVLWFSKITPVEPTVASTIDTLLTRRVQNVRGYRHVLDSLRRVRVVPILIPARVDTFEIYNVTYQVPVIPYTFKDSIPIFINKKRVYVPFDLMVDGYVSEYSIKTYATDFYTEKRKFTLNWKVLGLGALGVGMCTVLILLLAK